MARGAAFLPREDAQQAENTFTLETHVGHMHAQEFR